jgi:hypothetical protein
VKSPDAELVELFLNSSKAMNGGLLDWSYSSLVIGMTLGRK